MRVAHWDCFSGASGDMVLAALIDAGVSADAIGQAIASLGLPIRFEAEKIRRGGFAATRVHIEAEDQQEYRFLPQIEAIIDGGQLTDRQRELAKRIFRRLAEAESQAHGLPLERIHFHEVGALDSIADIIGSAVGLDLLDVERFTCRSVPTGYGSVKCEHGIMPIPTPGTAALLIGVPIASSPIKAELTTPTGAAILTTIVHEWTDTPSLTIRQIGHGAGKRDFIEQPNLLRLLVGEAATTTASPTDQVCVLETNLDDVPGEIIGFTLERLLTEGALDAYTQPIQMKKGRPGVILGVIAQPADVPKLEAVIFRQTRTLGIRKHLCNRSILHRQACTVETPLGSLAAKRAVLPDGSTFTTPEYEDCARLARERNWPLWQVYECLSKSLQ